MAHTGLNLIAPRAEACTTQARAPPTAKHGAQASTGRHDNTSPTLHACRMARHWAQDKADLPCPALQAFLPAGRTGRSHTRKARWASGAA